MFPFKKRIDPDLKKAIENKYYKTHRCIIQCSALTDSLENKIKSYKGSVEYTIKCINCICAELPSSAIHRLLEYPNVQYISLDSQALLCGTSILRSNGVLFQEKYKLTGKNITVGIIDSGVYPHPDLISPRNKIKSFVDLINLYKYPYDDNGHGTMVSGIIGGNGSVSKGMYKGVAENCSFFSVKAFNSLGRAHISTILKGISLILEEAENFNVKVILLPFELTSNDEFILSVFSRLFFIAIEKGITVIVPSGHNGNDQGSICGIATLSNCITVGGLDTTTTEIKPYKYSSSGPFCKLEKPDLSAAAVDICSLNSDLSFISEKNSFKIYPSHLEKPYTTYTGTSCAAAFIAGVVTLLYENNPDLKFNDITALLKVSSRIHNFSKHIQGAGSIDFHKLMP